MIKCNVSVVGVICRGGESRTDKEGRQFFTFGLRTTIPSNNDLDREMDISVSMNGNPSMGFDFREGKKVKVSGTLTFKKRNDIIYLNLSATDVSFETTAETGIQGTMKFRGTTGSKDIPEKKGKKGNYRFFDAFSSEKIDADQYAFIWVHFADFSANRPDWLGPKTGIDVEGELDISEYNQKVSINCTVDSLSYWDKQSNQ